MRKENSLETLIQADRQTHETHTKKKKKKKPAQRLRTRGAAHLRTIIHVPLDMLVRALDPALPPPESRLVEKADKHCRLPRGQRGRMVKSTDLSLNPHSDTYYL